MRTRHGQLHDIHSIAEGILGCMQLAGSLKLWLECLPEPLIAPDLAKILVQATYCLDETERLPVMQQVLCHVSLGFFCTAWSITLTYASEYCLRTECSAAC